MKQQIIIPSGKYKVLCRCFTYNQSQYIVDTLKGFIMQQTNFPFVCMVVDDCSTDGEQDVIKSFLGKECDMANAEYYENDLANIIYVNHISNQNCVMAVYLLKENLYLQKDKKMSLVTPWRQACKYEAMCEGDDYWTDPLKLQKQFDFLESHPDYGMCYTKCRYFYQKEKRKSNKAWGGPFEKTQDFIKRNPVPTLTVLGLIKALKEYEEQINDISHSWKMGDYPIWLWMSLFYKVKFLEDETGVYRVLDNSAMHGMSEQGKSAIAHSMNDIVSFFNEKYNLGLTNYYLFCRDLLVDMKMAALYGHCSRFINLWLSGIKFSPKFLFNMTPYKFLLFFILPSLRKERVR